MPNDPTPAISATDSVRVPDHVVFRTFAAETVVLNLETGKYHGLNNTAGRMLEVLQELKEIRQAAARLAEEYGQPQAVVESDITGLCEGLLARGLLAVDAPRA